MSESTTTHQTADPIVLKGLSLRFGDKTVLNQFDLRVARGETVVMTGQSGCGKSSILMCLLGFLQPTGGTMTIEGTAIKPDTIWSLRRKVALVPQDPDLGSGTVEEGLEELLELSANSPLASQGDALERELAALGLTSEILKQSAADVSGGERQRIAFASALMLKRPIMFLDEPTSALDGGSASRVYKRLSSLTDTTILMVSHDQEANLSFADRVVNLTGEAE